MRKIWNVHIHTYTHTLEYYTAITVDELVSFLTVWVDLDGIRLSEIGQRKTNAI